MKLKTYHDEIYVQYYSMLAPEHCARVWKVPGSSISSLSSARGKIEDIRVRDINLWLTEFDSAGAARKAFKILRQIINAAIADEAYPDDVAEPKISRCPSAQNATTRETRAMTPREINKLLRAVYGWEYEATVICGVWLGLRRSEQCGLQWRDINLKTGVVMIRRGLQVVDREVTVTDVKTHRSLRPNVLPKVAVQRLREIKRQLNPKPTDWLMSDPNPENYARKLRSFTKKKRGILSRS